MRQISEVLFVLLLWGSWPIFSKAAAVQSSPVAALFWSLVTATASAGLVVLASGQNVTLPRGAALAAAASGIALGSGMVLFYRLLSKHGAYTVTALTGLYPLVTVLLAWLVFHEAITPTKLAGAVLAVAAIVLLAM